MESLFKLNNAVPSIHNRIRTGSNKENQAPMNSNLRFKYSAGPIGIPFKPKNSNTIHLNNGLNSNLLRSQTNTYDKLNLNNGLMLHKSNTSYCSDLSTDDYMNSIYSSANSLRAMPKSTNQSSLSNSSNSSSSNNKLNDLYKSHLSGSTSSLLSYTSSNENSMKEDRRNLPPPPKQNIMYHEQRYKTELCRAYEEQKNCVYGDRCMFAHGLWELKRPITRHPKYKTQKCVAFEEQGLCMFGTRCSFLHKKIGSAEEIVNAILKLNKHKQSFPMPENLSNNSKSEANRLDTINEQDLLAKSINDNNDQRKKFLTSLKSENLFDWTSKPTFNLHPRSLNSAYENIVRLDCLNEYNCDKDKLLPDLTSLLVDDHANANTLLFNDGTTNSTRLPIFEKISSTNSLQSSINESMSNLLDNLDSSNNSSKSSSSLTIATSSTCSDMSISDTEIRSMDCEI